ncbi:MAG: hypothetical protein Q7W30_04055 [Coriobacteriia bacterium]|nr:hypothetical protein [Coriobacteriia bacterium]
MSKVLWIALLLVGAQVNLSALVPAAPGQTPPPWWVGGGILWPFFADTRTLMPRGDLLDLLTPVLGITATVCFLAAVAALAGWVVPAGWTPWLIGAGAVASVVLQVMWLSGWAVVPLVVDAALLWSVFAASGSAVGMRG